MAIRHVGAYFTQRPAPDTKEASRSYRAEGRSHVDIED
jgi:hypothetical protein